MKRPLLGPLIAALIVGAGLILGGLMGYLPDQLPDVFKNHPVRFWGSVIGLIGLLVGYAFAQAQLSTSPANTRPSTGSDQRQAEHNRRIMLQKVWRTWVEGVLNESLYHDTLIALHKQSRPDAVRPPRNAVIKQSEHTDQPLPPDTPILQVFDDSNAALLILGAPGSGKTTLLLELARDLIECAGRDPNHPIPVIFPLSTWATIRRPIDEWLVDELVDRYAVPRKLAQTWISSDSVLPLLDGLDEVTLSARDACVDAINVFRATRGDLPIAVCSRIKDYDELTVKLRFHSAIAVQPLSREQIRQYVRNIRFPFIPSSTSPLWDLLDTPLMLNIATLAYVDQPDEALRTTGGLADMQGQLIALYVDRRLSQFPPNSRYSAAQTKHHLSWLAWQMQRHDQTVFYLERMQPDWLPQQHRPVLNMLYMLVSGLVGGLGFGLIGGLGFGLIGGLLGGLYGGLYGGYLPTLIGEQEITLTDSVQWSWTEKSHELRDELDSLFFKWLHRMLYGGLGFGLIIGLLGGLYGGLNFGLIIGLGVALVIVLVNVLTMVLISGLSPIEIEYRMQPNQGIHRSGKSALLVGLLYSLFYGLGLGLGFELVGTLVGKLRFGLVIGWGYGLMGGLGFGLFFGGDAWIRHYLLRLLLVRQGVMPWRYVPFLNFAAQRILLRKVGGGYIFIHRLLLDYFAKQYTGPETAEVNTTSKGT